MTTPSQPTVDSGRPSTSMTTSSMRSRAAFSTVASLSAQHRWIDLAAAAHRDVEGQPLLDGVVARDDPVHRLADVLTLDLGEEPDVARG